MDDLKGTKKKAEGIVTFTVVLLWMHGSSIKGIAILTGRTNGSIRGIVHRRFPEARDAMSIEQRQAALDTMKAARIDGGKLPEKYFTAIPLKAIQQRPAPGPGIGPLSQYRKRATKPESTLPEPDPKTREGRKEILRRKKEASRKEKIEAAKREEREKGGASNRGLGGAALEYLHEMGWLADPADRSVDAPRLVGISSKERRKEAGRILRAYIDGCRIGGLTAIDLERVGTGSNSRLAISAYRLQAIHALGAIKQMMPDRDYALIEAVVDRDEFIWDKVPSTQARGFIYEAIRRSLDVVAVYEEMMGRQAFKLRWGFEPKIVTVMERDDARRMSNRAEEVLRQAR